VQVRVGKRRAGGVDVLAGEFEGVDYGAEDGGEIGVGAAKPGFGWGHGDIVGLCGSAIRNEFQMDPG
jgi:hypothetical protein